MGSLRDELAADYADAIGGYEQTFEWEGETFACVRSTDAAGLSIRPGGGLLDGYSLQVKRVDPNIGQIVLWAGPPDGGGAD